jgi:hypothetical protein
VHLVLVVGATVPADGEYLGLSMETCSADDADHADDADMVPSELPHLRPYLAAPRPSTFGAAPDAGRSDEVAGYFEGSDAEAEHEVEGSDTEAENEEDYHLWSVRPGHWGRSTDIDWHDQRRLKNEQEVAENCHMRWQDRGPRPKAGAERPGFWRGQAWRPGTERWSNRGGRHKEYYQWMARNGGLKGGKSSSSGDGNEGGKSSGSGDGYKGGKSSGSGKGCKGKGGKSSGSGKGGKGKDDKGKGGKGKGGK